MELFRLDGLQARENGKFYSIRVDCFLKLPMKAAEEGRKRDK